jgi:hypothetical protein
VRQFLTPVEGRHGLLEPGTAAEDHHSPSPPRSSARGSSAFV